VLLWHRLQEHGGIHNSHAEQALTREKAAWEEQKRQEMDALKQAAAAGGAATAPAEVAAAPAAASAAPAAPAEVPVEAARPPSDEPWIETIRCSSCNECQNINDKLFAYNDNKQAYFKDLGAGTYRQIVEAAEACQVAIIHPGKPKNPNEPGLEELLERAKPFL
jgi:ferredoxin